MSESTIPGQWTPYGPVSTELEAVFKEAIAGLRGVNYQPLVAATQVVNGTNFSYFCNATPVYPNSPTFGVVVSIYAPTGAQPHLIGIERVQQR